MFPLDDDVGGAKFLIYIHVENMRQYPMGIKDRAEATAKNVEGKAQETVGEATGDTSQKTEGKAKQGQAKVEHAKEDVKDQAKKAID